MKNKAFNGVSILILMGIVFSLLACLGGDEDTFDEDAQVNACFVHCNAGFGVSQSCFGSTSDYNSDGDCSDKASSYCGSNQVIQSELVSDCNCSASCEPDWYSE